VIAICDENLLGKKFEEGIRQLEVRESFFKGDQMSKKEVLDLIKRGVAAGSTFNIVGKESINCALECEITEESLVHKIKGIPFAIIV